MKYSTEDLVIRLKENIRRWRKEHPEMIKTARHRWVKNNPGAVKAQRILNNAIKHGLIIRPDTCSCGRSNPGGHHSDYSKPLMVSWLCHSCHKKIHKKNHND